MFALSESLRDVTGLWRDAAEDSLELAPLELLSELLSLESSMSTPNLLALVSSGGRAAEQLSGSWSAFNLMDIFTFTLLEPVVSSRLRASSPLFL